MTAKNKKTMLIGAAALAAFYFFTKGKSIPGNPNVNPYDENNYTGPVDAIDPSGGGSVLVDAGDLGFKPSNGGGVFSPANPSSINGANGVFL